MCNTEPEVMHAFVHKVNWTCQMWYFTNALHLFYMSISARVLSKCLGGRGLQCKIAWKLIGWNFCLSQTGQWHFFTTSGAIWFPQVQQFPLVGCQRSITSCSESLRDCWRLTNWLNGPVTELQRGEWTAVVIQSSWVRADWRRSKAFLRTWCKHVKDLWRFLSAV